MVPRLMFYISQAALMEIPDNIGNILKKLTHNFPNGNFTECDEWTADDVLVNMSNFTSLDNI